MQDLLTLDPRGEAVDALHAATAVYTTSPVVKNLLRQVNWPERGGRLLDPSAGDGAFVIGALDLLEIQPDDIEAASRVRGWEIHPGAVADARDRVAEFLTSRGWNQPLAAETARAIISEVDFLDQLPEVGFSVIVGNPPFLRLVNLPPYFRSFYASRVPKHAQADILFAFLDKCSAMLPHDGVIAMVTSDRWISNLSCCDLRASIGRRLGVSHLERLDVDTAFYRPKKRVKGSLPRIHPIEVVLESAGAGTRQLTREELRIEQSPLYESDFKLEDIAEIRLAPWLGGKGVFVVDAEQALKFPGADLVPAVDVDDIPSDRDVLTPPTRFAIRTSRDQEPTGALAAHLKSGFERMSKRARQRGIYWLPPEPMNLPLTGPRLLIPRIARRIRVIDLPEGVMPMDHNIQIAIPGRSEVLGGMKCSATIKSRTDELKAILSSEECDGWIKANAPRLENGFYSITTMLLRRMPVPRRLVGVLRATGTDS